ncbi:hypothetical protein QJS10_CPA06g00702 [Acorus calamus]|uniref:Uncharacterized protein n=1 Tax=Acorus calamus TaxID=4465 RepID=A0AAV9EIH3_ACOCL|nr:hypothetical protein QJS10_CPA06g00702 [Acorus calamus]
MNCNREEDSLMIASSHSSEPLIEARSFDPINADESQGPVNCGHFTIRGYVSEIRKRDLKNCLSFMMNHEPYNLDKLSSSLPPLQVPDFKWWGCQTCSKASDTIHAAIKERESTNRFGREAKSDTTCSHRTFIIESRNDSLQLIPDHGKVIDKSILEDGVLEKNISEERHGETKILINSDSGESTSLCCGEEKDSIGLNLVKEVTQGL